jgi:hypothetical protein
MLRGKQQASTMTVNQGEHQSCQSFINTSVTQNSVCAFVMQRDDEGIVHSNLVEMLEAIKCDSCGVERLWI